MGFLFIILSFLFACIYTAFFLHPFTTATTSIITDHIATTAIFDRTLYVGDHGSLKSAPPATSPRVVNDAFREIVIRYATRYTSYRDTSHA
jgi:hypothetical protein